MTSTKTVSSSWSMVLYPAAPTTSHTTAPMKDVVLMAISASRNAKKNKTIFTTLVKNYTSREGISYKKMKRKKICKNFWIQFLGLSLLMGSGWLDESWQKMAISPETGMFHTIDQYCNRIYVKRGEFQQLTFSYQGQSWFTDHYRLYIQWAWPFPRNGVT